MSLPSTTKYLHNHLRAVKMSIKTQSSNYFPISTSHTNINIEQLTLLTSYLCYNLCMSCRDRLMNGMGEISNNRQLGRETPLS